MIVNRIRELRKAKGLTLAKLAEAVNSTTTTIQRIEKNEVDLLHELLLPIARVLDVDWFDLLRPPSAALAGLSESAAPFQPAPTHHLARMPLGESEALFEAKNDDLDRIGVYRGDVLIFDLSPKAVRQVATGDIVVAQVYGPGLTNAATVLREFVAPSLLIANSTKSSPLPVDLDRDDAAIKGVAVRRFGALRRTR